MGQAGEHDSEGQTPEIGGLDRWAAWLGSTVAAASLGLVALADFGWFRASLAIGVIALVALLAAIWWHPPLRWPSNRHAFRPSISSLITLAILAIGIGLIAPGSENIAGPRDQAVYVATGFAIADGGSTTIFDPALRLLVQQVQPDYLNAWLYENKVNHIRIRFPAQLFLRGGLEPGYVEGGFLPVVPVWIALAGALGGLEPALHVAGFFGVLALVYVMLACAAAARGTDGSRAPSWQPVGAILAVSFSQIWWAREPMSESALGGFAWLTAWAGVRWTVGGGWRWAALAALATVAGLFTRADGILLAGALVLLVVVVRARGWWAVPAILVPGLCAAELHYMLIATTYMGTTYGAFTLGRAFVGFAAVTAVATALIIAVVLRRTRLSRRAPDQLGAAMGVTRRGLTVIVALIVLVAAISSIASGAERETAAGAGSPLTWLPGYVPWPQLGLAAVGFAVLGWSGAPRPLLPLLLVGGIPALFYLPDPLVTGDHPWMVRRLVPTIIPLIAIAGSIGASALWHAPSSTRFRALRIAGPSAAAVLVGLALALGVAMDRDLVGPRHGAGTVAGITALAAELPANALVVFDSGPAGIHLAMPLDMVFGIDAFAIPQATLGPTLATTLARLEANGRATYWATEDHGSLSLPPGVEATPVRTVRIRYRVADHGLEPPPLQLGLVDDVVTLYRLSYPPE